MSGANLSGTMPSSTESVGGSPGTILRRCREFHGITLEEASETTKIGITHLKALEDDRIRDFANQAYLKGFVRIYATYLGLNSDDVARMYGKLFGVTGENSDLPRTSSTSVHKPRRLFSLNKLIFPAFFLVAIIITATFFKKSPAPLIRKPQSTAVVIAPPMQIPVVQKAQSSVRTSAEVHVAPPVKTERVPVKPEKRETAIPSKLPAETAKGFILKIKVTRNGTLTATVDGSTAEQYELTVGDVIEWKAENKVVLDLSNAGGVDVELNGKPYRQLGVPGKPLYVELDANGVIP
jgi:cytoskeletal protein RodZ